MKYLLITAILAAFMLTACGDPKPAQYPPSLYKDFEDPLTDEDLAEAKRKSAEKRAAEQAAAAKSDDAAEEVDDAEEEAKKDDSY
ncbi:MAG: hypothetical protein H0V39_03635 [Nitrosomonas sp.]|nr:hypothetical protein [Nitrosomonas sp.]